MKSTLSISSDFRNCQDLSWRKQDVKQKKNGSAKYFSPSISYLELIKAHEDNIITLDFKKRILKLQN